MMMSYAKLRNKNIYKSDEISSLVELHTVCIFMCAIHHFFCKNRQNSKDFEVFFIHLLNMFRIYIFLLFVQKFKRVL